MLTGLKKDLGRGARTAGRAIVASLLMGVGLAFLTVAAWIELAQWLEPSAAAAILGALYVAAGLLVTGVVGQRASKKNAPPAPHAEALVESFLTGMATGQAAGSKRH